MAIKNICPKCKKAFSAPEGDLGKKVECPACGHQLDPPDRRGGARARRGPDRAPEEDRGGPGEDRPHRAHGGAEPGEQPLLRGVRDPGRSGPPLQPERALPVPPGAGALGGARPRGLPGGLPGAPGHGAHGLPEDRRGHPQCAAPPPLPGGLGGGGGRPLPRLQVLGELAFLLADVGDQQNDLVQVLLESGTTRSRPSRARGGAPHFSEKNASTWVFADSEKSFPRPALPSSSRPPISSKILVSFSEASLA